MRSRSKAPEPVEHSDEFWARVNAKYRAAVKTWQEQGVDVPATRMRVVQAPTETQQPKPRPSRAKSGPDERRAHRFDHGKAAELYQSGKTVAEIVKEMGVSPQSIRNALKSEGVYDPSRDLRQPTKDPKLYCEAGLHNMTVWGRQIYKRNQAGKRVKGGRYCEECRRIRAKR